MKSKRVIPLLLSVLLLFILAWISLYLDLRYKPRHGFGNRIGKTGGRLMQRT